MLDSIKRKEEEVPLKSHFRYLVLFKLSSIFILFQVRFRMSRYFGWSGPDFFFSFKCLVVFLVFLIIFNIKTLRRIKKKTKKNVFLILKTTQNIKKNYNIFNLTTQNIKKIQKRRKKS